MAEASSKITTMRLPWLCRPAKASERSFDHGIWSMRHVFCRSGSPAMKMAVAVSVNSWRAMNNWYHLPNSAHVFVRSCVSVFAVTTPRVSALVLMAHRIAQDTSALLPMPWPEATSSSMTQPSAPPSRIALLMRSCCSSCHCSGPVMPSSIVPFSPHGKAQRTNPTKSSWKLASLSSNSPTSEPAYRSAERRVMSTGTSIRRRGSGGLIRVLCGSSSGPLRVSCLSTGSQLIGASASRCMNSVGCTGS